MDWLKLLTLLVAVAFVQIKADGPKKKIRIHLPQAVKHIHHHKKIYITNHAAPSQYAPAFMPSAEGAVAVPTNIALPTVTKLMPINSVDVIEEPVRVPGLAASASKLLPLYRARGYYGPNQSEWEEQDYDFAPSSEPADSYPVPTSILAPSDVHNTKRVKVVKLHDTPRKKVIRKAKPKRTSSRKPTLSHHEDEHPVSTFHEQFYSDVQDTGAIRKVKKPPRVEKILDGNTEHIHTYSEEHIHKVLFDDEPKYPGVVGVEPIAAMSAYTPYIPLKNGQLIAMTSNPYQTLALAGSLGTPMQYEYAAYNPRDVTHDHIFHDHGELPEEIDLTREIMSIPPKVSYNSQGLRLGASQTKKNKNKYLQRPTKAPSSDYGYYDGVYSSNRVKPVKATASPPLYVQSHDESLNEFKPVSTYRFKEGVSKGRNKIPTYYGKPAADYRYKHQPSVPSPFAVSSKIVHDYVPRQHSYQAGTSVINGLSLYEDNPFVNFKESQVNNFEYDNYASPSNIHRSEEKSSNNGYDPHRKGTKSVSTQNIRFGARGLTGFSENFPNNGDLLIDDGAPSALENVDSFDQTQYPVSVDPTSFLGKDSSANYQYYKSVNVKAIDDDQLSEQDASNDNYQYAEAPAITTAPPIIVATTPPSKIYDSNLVTSELTPTAPQIQEKQENKRYSIEGKNVKAKAPLVERYRVVKSTQSSGNFVKHRLPSSPKQGNNFVSPTTERSKLRYGDKI